ncbi:hypothetical protein MesoLjLa_18090 [Mesorhizobium sp. L-2-11]|nr:hypothetical protein MesoLjLa_18090 [Mesorhizobium sp. L-2-11]
MTNEPTTHSAGLELSEDFVNRAVALRGGKNLDGAFLMDLLEAGLAIMELSQGHHNERCTNPKCNGCRLQMPEPSPTVMVEFAELHAQLDRVAENAADGQNPQRAITLQVSDASLIFMAWLDRLIESRIQGSLRVVGPAIDIDRQADFDRAGRYLANLLVGNLEDQLAEFIEGRHPLLFPPRRAKAS